MNDVSIRDTDEDWRQIALQHPYWGVISSEDFRGSSISAANQAQFFASGERLVRDIGGFIRSHLKEDFQPEASLDFGCGVGRLLIPIAKMSGRAVGVDIAPKMLEIAKGNVTAAELKNVSLVVADDTLSRLEGEFDFINTYIVMQHIPPERGYRVFRHLLSRLRVGGIGSIQLTYAKSRKFFIHEAQKARYYRREGRALIDLGEQVEREPPPGSITMFDYDLNQIFALISEVAGSPILTLPTNDDNHLGLHLIFARAR